MTEQERLQQALAHLEAQRALLGDAVVEAAIAALRRQMAELQARSRPAEQQRKQVTVLFGDLSGFTALAETMDAEELTDLLNALWETLDAAIVAHGGFIDKHVGDAVMALWGTEQAREDDPEQAVRAALAMQGALEGFCQARGVPLSMRIGINTGPVLLGNVGITAEFTAMGDTVNLANRLEQAAPAGGILIGPATYRAIRGLFQVEDLSPLRVKGKRKPLPVYRVLAARPRAFRGLIRGVEGVATRMVGREEEMRFLQESFRQAMEGAGPRMVTLLGEAGVGKSRLLYEFEEWLGQQPGQVVSFRSRATQEMESIPYSLWRDLFAYRFDISESDRAATAMAKFRAGVAGYLDADQADLVGHFVGFDFSASRAVDNLRGSPSFRRLALSYLTRYLRAVTGKPTVFLLDDLHWADTSSLDLLEQVTAEVGSGRWFMLCLARPELLERRPEWGKGTVAQGILVLRPLSEEDSRALLALVLQKVPYIPDELSGLIIRVSGGNPFYVEEMVQMLIEEGVIVRGEGEWAVHLARLDEIRVPATLRAVLQARLERLPGREKGVLQRAAVIGQVFWDMAVAALEEGQVEEGGLDEIAAALESLRGRGMVFRQERSAFAGASEYTFKHALLRDVAYEMVLRKERRAYHRRVAEWLESRLGGRLAEYGSLIAGHYEQAGEKALASGYLRRVGEELRKVNSYDEAARVLERALGLWPEEDPAGRAEVLVALGNICEVLGNYVVAAERLEAGLELARRLGREGVAAEALCGLSYVAFQRGEYGEADALGQAALEAARRAGNRHLEALAWHRLGMTVRERGDYDGAERHLRRSLSLWRVLGDRLGIAACLNSLGLVAYDRGDYDGARQYLQESLTIKRELGDRWGIAASLNNLGMVSMVQRDCAAAEGYYEESLTLFRSMGYRAGEASILNNLGLLATIRGDYARAVDYHSESLALSRALGGRARVASVLNNLGTAAVGAGKDGMAWECFCQALLEARDIGALQVLLDVLAGMAGIYVRAGRPERAGEVLGLALGHPASHGEVANTARPVLDALRTALPEGDLQAALERGRGLDLTATIEALLTDCPVPGLPSP